RQVQTEHHRTQNDHKKKIPKPLCEGVAEQLRKRLNVKGRSIDQSANGIRVEELQTLSTDVVVNIHAKVVNHTLAEHLNEVGRANGEHPPKTPDNQQYDAVGDDHGHTGIIRTE